MSFSRFASRADGSPGLSSDGVLVPPLVRVVSRLPSTPEVPPLDTLTLTPEMMFATSLKSSFVFSASPPVSFATVLSMLWRMSAEVLCVAADVGVMSDMVFLLSCPVYTPDGKRLLLFRVFFARELRVLGGKLLERLLADLLAQLRRLGAVFAADVGVLGAELL